jgi:hypothetical protein
LNALLQEFLFLNVRITMAANNEDGSKKKENCGCFSEARKIAGWLGGANHSYSHGSILLRFFIAILSLEEVYMIS